MSRADWMKPCYELRRPELALVVDMAAGRIGHEASVRELEALDWPRGEAVELAELLGDLVVRRS